MSKPKLLLADDSVTIRKVVELTFTDEGLDVTTVANGEEAMQKLAEIQPDIVIADVNMPEPTGYQICEHIKQNEATRDIPVLLVVGSFEPFDQTEAERVGADGFLTKPFQSIRDLILRVDELLGTESRAAPAAASADIDNLYEQSFVEGSDAGVDDLADLMLGDAGMDDEIIEMSHPGGDAAEQKIAASGRSGAAAPVEPIVPVTSSSASATSARNDTDLNGDEILDVKPVAGKADVSAPKRAPEDTAADEPSDAFINLVARRVVEKLSDKVVRDIAKEAVPRVAEKLIREALEDNRKSK